MWRIPTSMVRPSTIIRFCSLKKKKKRENAYWREIIANRSHSHRCLSSKIPCKYPDQPPEEEPEEETPALWWPEDIENACAEWKETGEPPFVSLAPSPSWHNMEMKDLRYIYKMALVANILELSNTNDICLLWGEMGVWVQPAWPILLFSLLLYKKKYW